MILRIPGRFPMSDGWRATVPAVSKADGVHRQRPVHPILLFRIYPHPISPSRYSFSYSGDWSKNVV